MPPRSPRIADLPNGMAHFLGVTQGRRSGLQSLATLDTRGLGATGNSEQFPATAERVQPDGPDQMPGLCRSRSVVTTPCWHEPLPGRISVDACRSWLVSHSPINVVADNAIAAVGGEQADCRDIRSAAGVSRVTRKPSPEIQRFLDLPDLLMLTRRIYLGRITHGDPPDRTSSPAAGRVDCTTPWIRTSLPARTQPGTRRAGGQEAAIADPRAR